MLGGRFGKMAGGRELEVIRTLTVCFILGSHGILRSMEPLSSHLVRRGYKSLFLFLVAELYAYVKFMLT